MSTEPTDDVGPNVRSQLQGRIDTLNSEIRQHLHHRQLLTSVRNSMNSVYAESCEEVKRRVANLMQYLQARQTEILDQMREAADNNMARLNVAERQNDLRVETLKAEIKRLDLLLQAEASSVSNLEDLIRECHRTGQMDEEPPPTLPSFFDRIQPDLGPGTLQLFAYQAPLNNTVRVRSSDLMKLERGKRHHMGQFFAHGLPWSLAISPNDRFLGLYAVLSNWDELKSVCTVDADFSLVVRKVHSGSGLSDLQRKIGDYAQYSPEKRTPTATTQSKPTLTLASHTIHRVWQLDSDPVFGVAQCLPLKRLFNVDWVDLILDVHRVSFGPV